MNTKTKALTPRMADLLARLPENFEVEVFKETPRAHAEAHVSDALTHQLKFRLTRQDASALLGLSRRGVVQPAAMGPHNQFEATRDLITAGVPYRRWLVDAAALRALGAEVR